MPNAIVRPRAALNRLAAALVAPKTSLGRAALLVPILAVFLAVAGSSTTPAAAQSADTQGSVVEGTCTADDFAEVVDASGGALRALNDRNTPRFQDLLRALKAKRGWDNATFLERARPFVEDERIQAYDAETEQLLTRINSLGSEGGETTQVAGEGSPSPDCALLPELRDHLARLVATMQAKWDYMFAKVEGALAE